MKEIQRLKQMEEMLFKNMNVDNISDEEFDWLLENESDLSTTSNKLCKNKTIVVDGRRIKNNSKARKLPLGPFNKFRQIQRQREFFNDVENGKDLNKIRIVTDGDSWFNYPTKLQEIIDNLFKEFSIYSLGYAGDWLANIYKEGEYINPIRLYKPDVFLISGGGNDLVGSKRMETLLKKYKNGSTAEELIIKNRFEKIIEDSKVLYNRIFTDLTSENSKLKIICHGYDYPYLDGKEKVWFGKPMKRKGIVDKNLRNQIAKYMMDAFNDMLSVLSDNFPNVYYLDLRNKVSRNNWKDELHPNNKGFKQISVLFRKKIIEITS